jgi:hypothetical protein
MATIKHFPHYLNARNDRKIRKGRLQLGIEFYAIYFMVLEVLAEQKDFRYPLTDLDILADDFGTSIQKIQLVITQYDLFEIDPIDQFFSPAQHLALQPYLEKMEHYRLMGKKSALARKLKTERQIEEMKKFSQGDSSQPALNDSSTQVTTYAEQLTNITNKLTNKLDKYTHTLTTEDWLKEYCKGKSAAYKADMRKKIIANDEIAMLSYEEWKNEKLKQYKEIEQEQIVKTYDYSIMVGAKINGQVIKHVINDPASNYIDIKLENDELMVAIEKTKVLSWIHKGKDEIA